MGRVATYFIISIFLMQCETPSNKKANKNTLVDFLEAKPYTDKLVSISVSPVIYRMDFTLENKSKAPISLIWDECAIIDENGKSHSVFGLGVKYADATKPKSPTMVHAGSKIENTFMSTDVRFETRASDTLELMDNGYYPASDYWFIKSLFSGPKDEGAPYERNIRAVYAIETNGKKKYITTNLKFGKKLNVPETPAANIPK